MEKLVEQLVAFPSSNNLPDAELSKQCNSLLVNFLHKVAASNLASNVNGTNLLDLLNPGRNSLPYLFVLYVSMAGEAKIERGQALTGCL
jgi:hypothetical protein